MSEEKKDDVELTQEFFRHDLKNKIQVIESFQELIEETDDIETVHRYTKKIQSTRKDIAAMAEEAEKLMRCSEKTELDLQRCIQGSLDRLHSSIECYGSSVGVKWNAEDYTAELNPAVENMLYNLFENSVKHGTDDVQIDVNDSMDSLEIDVYDGGNVENWDDIFPEEADSKSDYPSTGAYLIDTVAENNDIEIESSEGWSYTVRIPRESY